MIKDATGLLTVFCFLAAMGWYIPLIVRRRVSPAPATWIIGTLAMNLAVASYHAIPGRTVIENVTLYGASFEITVVTGFIFVILHRSGNLKVAFDWVQKACLVVMLVTLAYWFFHKDQSRVTFWTTQTLLVVAYVATITKAVQRRTAFDSIGNWFLIFAASVFGSIPAIIMTSPYGIVNSFRGVVSAGITVLVLIYFDRKNGWSRWNDEKRVLSQFWFGK